MVELYVNEKEKYALFSVKDEYWRLEFVGGKRAAVDEETFNNRPEGDFQTVEFEATELPELNFKLSLWLKNSRYSIDLKNLYVQAQNGEVTMEQVKPKLHAATGLNQKQRALHYKYKFATLFEDLKDESKD